MPNFVPQLGPGLRRGGVTTRSHFFCFSMFSREGGSPGLQALPLGILDPRLRGGTARVASGRYPASARSLTNIFVARSCANVLAGPCPGIKFVSLPSGHSFSTIDFTSVS